MRNGVRAFLCFHLTQPPQALFSCVSPGRLSILCPKPPLGEPPTPPPPQRVCGGANPFGRRHFVWKRPVLFVPFRLPFLVLLPSPKLLPYSFFFFRRPLGLKGGPPPPCSFFWVRSPLPPVFHLTIARDSQVFCEFFPPSSMMSPRSAIFLFFLCPLFFLFISALVHGGNPQLQVFSLSLSIPQFFSFGIVPTFCAPFADSPSFSRVSVLFLLRFFPPPAHFSTGDFFSAPAIAQLKTRLSRFPLQHFPPPNVPPSFRFFCVLHSALFYFFVRALIRVLSTLTQRGLSPPLIRGISVPWSFWPG